jgi:hypothetical protein
MTTNRFTRRLTAAMALALASGVVGAATLHDEALSEDLSDDHTVPTILALAAGSNDVLGTTGITLSGTDRDFARLVVHVGFELTGMVVLPGTQTAGGVSFVALQAGDALTINPAAPNPALLLGWLHYSTADIGRDILPEIGETPGSIGFTGPLPSGSYALWIQDNGFEVAKYGFRFEVAAVPEPETYAMLGAGLGIIGLVRFRRRSGR